MLGLVHRRMVPALLGIWLVLGPVSFAWAQEAKTSAQFDVAIGALRVGVFWIDGSTSRRAYTVSSGFQSTGLIGGLADVAVAMTARGTRRDGQFFPARYGEDVRAGRRQGAIVMTYRNGVPKVSGQKIRDEDDDDDTPPVDAATQKGTLDPLSATFALLHRQPLAGACQVDRFMFDGERRTRVVMTTLRQERDIWVCSGQFLRLAGYSERDLRRSGVVDVVVRYRLEGDDLVATQAQFRSLRGVLRLTRR